MVNDETPCRCGPGVVHEPLPPDWLEKQVAKAAENLAKEIDRWAFATVMERLKP